MRRAAVILLLIVVVPAAVLAGTVVTAPAPRDAAGWSRLADMPGARGEVAAASVEVDGRTMVFVVGGFEGLARTSDAVAVYDPATDTWRDGPALPAARHHPAAATLDGIVYVSGGSASGRQWEGTSDVWALPAGGDAWESAPSLPEPRLAHRMVAVDGRLYVVGGIGPTGRVLVFDPDVGWSAGATMPEPRDHLGAVVVDGEIWAVGGRHTELVRRIDIYDPAADTWRAGPPLPEPVSAAAVGLVGGRLVVVGGEDPSALGGWVTDAHWQLDLASGSWERGPRPVLGVHGAGDAVVGDRLLVLGGASRQGWWSVTSWSAVAQALGGEGWGSAADG